MGNDAFPEEQGGARAAVRPAGDAPLRYYGQSPRWRLLSLRELWRHREMLWMMGVRDLKVRYRQTLVGVAWVLIHPTAMGMVLVVFFTLLGAQPSKGEVPFPLVLLSGLLLWNLFAGIVSQASASLVGNPGLINKVAFPRLILPLSTVMTNLVDFAFGLLLPVGLMVYYGITPWRWIIFLPPFVLMTVIAALAFGIWFSALNAIYRDVGYLVGVLLQIGFFTSPVVYSIKVIPEKWRPLMALNPMVGPVEGFRWSLYGYGGDLLPRSAVLTSAAVTGVILVTGLAYFRRIEGVLADRI